MEMKGEQLIPASQQVTWDALNDPEVLKQCVPGCESIEPVGENSYQVLMVARVGPVSAKFKGKLTLSDIVPPQSYSIAFEGQGGAAGFAKGGAQVRLGEEGGQTRLAYDVKASVGGKLAQIGSRLVDAAAKKVADDFFRNFKEKLSAQGGGGGPAGDAGSGGGSGHASGGVQAAPAGELGHEASGHHAAEAQPVPRDPDLPAVSGMTVSFFAAGALVVYLVSLFTLF